MFSKRRVKRKHLLTRFLKEYAKREEFAPFGEDTFPERPSVQESKQGPFVQSIISLTSLLMVKMLTVLISTLSNSEIFLLNI